MLVDEKIKRHGGITMNKFDTKFCSTFISYNMLKVKAGPFSQVLSYFGI